MTKKLTSLLCAFVLVVTLNFPAFAASIPQSLECVESTSSISSRMAYFEMVFASVVINDKGEAEYTGLYTVDNPQKVRMTVTLQRSKDGKTWSNVSGESVKKTFDGQKTDMLYGNSSPLPHSYNYRTKVVAVALSSSGAALETITVYSKTQPYSLEVA